MMLAARRTTSAVAQPTPPPPPATIEETGLHPDTLAQLLLKTLVAGEASGTSLSEKLRLPYSVLDALIQHGRVEKLLEVRGASGAGSAGYRYVAHRPRARARRCSSSSCRATSARRRCRSGSTTPTCARAWRPSRISNRDRLATGFGNLVVSKGMFDQLGPAVNSGKSLFLYGAPGNGKTVLAEGIGRAYGDEMFMPYAIDVDGQTITMYDPVSHQLDRRPTGDAEQRRRERRASIAAGSGSSARWSSSAAS